MNFFVIVTEVGCLVKLTTLSIVLGGIFGDLRDLCCWCSLIVGGLCNLLLVVCVLMDGDREDSKYAVNYGMNQGYGLMQGPKGLVRNVPYAQSQMVTKYEDDDEVEDEEDEPEPEEERNVGDNEVNGSTHQIGVDDDDEDDDGDGDGNNGINNSVNMQRHPKKRKLKSLLLSYELAPRVPPVTPAPTSGRKYSYGGRNTLTDWTEHETFVLLEAWGDRFLQCGRKSLRSEEWQEVAD
ncbi:hypothetical protein Tco_1188151, partial [Tanacetum coccineum]